MKRLLLLLLAITVLAAGSASALQLTNTVFDNEFSRIRFSLASAGADSIDLKSDWGEDNKVQSFDDGSQKAPGTKSPGKAFALSMVMPGLGQLYYGSKIKAAGFVATEALIWALQFSWHSDAVKMEAAYESFNREHWSRNDYEQYLVWVYHESNDELINATEVSHHLPKTETQQFFEMTGKYDQFAWGWDDAVYVDGIDSSTLYDYDAVNPPVQMTSSAYTPYSQNRLDYMDMMFAANERFKDARQMIMFSMVNRLISSFEAYFSTKSRNKRLASGHNQRVKVRARLKSYYVKRDTPFIDVTYRF
ncbi:MAG: hypothetical protein V3T31_00640 [candidate division Zixibacteria bacterium]